MDTDTAHRTLKQLDAVAFEIELLNSRIHNLMLEAHDKGEKLVDIARAAHLPPELVHVFLLSCGKNLSKDKNNATGPDPHQSAVAT